MKKKVLCLFLALFFVISMPTQTYAETPYDGYNYDYWEDVVPSPASYVPEDSLSGIDLGVGNLLNPSDLCVTKSDEIYVTDTGNNRILVFDKNWKSTVVIDQFDNNGTVDHFNQPGGIFVTDAGKIYVADTANRRVVVLNADKSLNLIIENPQSETFPADFVFEPLRVGVDYADRVYVIAKNVFQGIMGFDEKGQFYGYIGTNKVVIDPTSILWRKLSTKAQRQKQELFIPTEFTGLDLDVQGFVYTTNIDKASDETIKRLNPAGDDVLKRQVGLPVNGDLFFRLGNGRFSGPSRFADIVVRDKGLFSAIDSQRGRIFTYDHEGNLLYIFGTMGSQIGTFKIPCAIEAVDDKIVVLDKQLGELIVFKPTTYGALINEAVGLRFDGEEERAVEDWKQVLKMDANFELAYVGIGKSLLANNKNKEAMKYLKAGMDQEYYSIAYKRYRNEVLKVYIPYLMNGGLILFVGMMGFKGYRQITGRRKSKNA